MVRILTTRASFTACRAQREAVFLLSFLGVSHARTILALHRGLRVVGGVTGAAVRIAQLEPDVLEEFSCASQEWSHSTCEKWPRILCCEDSLPSRATPFHHAGQLLIRFGFSSSLGIM
jgi:hypothetical protein